ncbi:MAG TPA: Ig-like domain-containing protein [Ramlibacter sp.]|nr:Ig-like domain-containing protein [Ramlibacter sp.]
MKTPQRKLISAAIALALAAGSAHAALERMGPVSKAPSVGGFPSWYQDKTGITLEFCDLKNQAELNGGWCVLIPPGPAFPETFPDPFFVEHFYYDANNVLTDANPPGGFRARLTVALEAAFATGAVIDGDQMTFARHRIFIPNLPWAGDYRVITPFGEFNYYDQKAGDRIFETKDVGLACINTFECTLGATLLGPFLLPSPAAGAGEVPPVPDLASAPLGTDPWYDLIAGATTADPGTGKKYLADPKRIGPVTGSPMAPFSAYDVGDGVNATQRNHNTFRIEVRSPSPGHNGPVIYAIDGENNFTVGGRLMDAAIPGKVSVNRATYKADIAGNVTDLDVFATALPTTQARIPVQPQPAAATPVVSFFDAACAGAVTTDPLTGAVTINPGPYSAPAAAEHAMAKTGDDFWAQSQPGTGQPPAYVCVKDATARNAAGQTVPAYYLGKVSDLITITDSWYDGSANATLTVKAVSSDPTAVLTLEGYGLSSGTAGPLAATVPALVAPTAKVQVTSTKGGATLRAVETLHGAAQLVGVPTAVSDSMTIMEDCSPVAATSCAQGVAYDILANDTVMVNNQVTSLRTLYDANPADFVITIVRAPTLGTYTLANGDLVYTPNPNANGTDSLDYKVAYLGQTSNTVGMLININAVNDIPVAGNVTSGAVVGKSNVLNLIAASTDPDGNADVKNAVITTWPAQLGAQPVPVNGVINYTPTSTGAFTINFQAKDAAGALSANTATATVSVAGSEAMAYTKQIFVAARNIGGATSTRWTVSGTDSVREGQTITIAYANGTIRSTGQACNGTDVIPACVIARVPVDSLGNWLFDQVGTQGGNLDPKDTVFWSVGPTNIKSWSSAPVLGGSVSTGIQFK